MYLPQWLARTGALFRSWILELDRDMRASSRNILLLLDNAPSHVLGDIVLTNIKIKMLPQNTTARMQPMDAGIIASMKAAYRSRQMEHALNLVESGEYEKLNGKSVYRVDQLQAMTWCDEIWSAMRRQIIANCFRHTRILCPRQYDDPDSNPEDAIDLDLDVEFACLSLTDIISTTDDIPLI